MHKLGEQWVEVIDGQEHMLKVVEKVSEKSYDCTGCIFNGHNGTCRYHSQNCPSGEVEHGYIKDLGILNEDGCLPCPFCGGYPKIIHPTENMPVVSIVHTGLGHRILLEFFSSEQQAIDAWNRRV